MKVFYSDTFELPLPAGHHFPAEKYRLTRNNLQYCNFREQLAFCPAPAISDEHLRLVHTEEYLTKLDMGTLTRIEQRKIGFPWSVAMVERSRHSTGATLAATRAALAEQAAVHLAGGTHHAFPDRGEGFCVFNDIAVATRVLQAEGAIDRAVIIDLDVHQGNGTAAIFAGDDSVFTFSMHGERNFPVNKIGSDLDIELADATEDDEYLERLVQALKQLPLAEADVVFTIAGADCYEHDRYGKLSLTKTGLATRDRLVFEACRHHKKPVTVVMGGGYSRDVADVVDINTATVYQLLSTIQCQCVDDARPPIF